MSFTNAPVTRTVVVGTVVASILASLVDVKHLLYIQVDVHIWQYHQLWRALIFQICHTNSSEAMFSAIAFYNMRTVERLWGSRKYASFLIVTYLLTSIVVPTLLVLFIYPLTGGYLTYLPSGPTPILFAVLSQYHAMVPHLYQYRLVLPKKMGSASSPLSSTGPGAQIPINEPSSPTEVRTLSSSSSSSTTATTAVSLTLSDKSYKYLLCAQVLLFQFPSSLPGAVVGWILGYAHRNDLFPPRLCQWRVPPWFVGSDADEYSAQRRRMNDQGGFEGLQRRLEQEGAVDGASTTGAVSTAGILAQGEAPRQGRRRNIGQQILGQFRGAF